MTAPPPGPHPSPADELAPLAAWDLDLATGRLSWSGSTLAEAPRPSSFTELRAAVHPDDRARFDRAFADAHHSGALRVAYRAGGAGAPTRWFEASGRLIRGAAGGPARLLGVCADVTERARLDDEARRALRVREDLIATVGHDLRNPLGVVMMKVALLRRHLSDDDGPERLEHDLEAIQRSAERIEQLVSDLLDHARIEAGRLELAIAPTDAGELLERACARMRPIAARRAQALAIAINGVPRVRCDRDRVVQVLASLIGAALALAPDGATLTVSASPAAGAAAVELAVSQRGGRLPVDRLAPLLAQPWPGRPAAREGLGLNLLVARGIVEAHGGRLWADAGFSVSLPAA